MSQDKDKFNFDDVIDKPPFVAKEDSFDFSDIIEEPVKKKPSENGQQESSQDGAQQSQNGLQPQQPGSGDIQPKPLYTLNGKPAEKEEITSQLVANTNEFVTKLLSGEINLTVHNDPALENMLRGIVKQRKEDNDHFLKNAWERGLAQGNLATEMLATSDEQQFDTERVAALQREMQSNKPRELYHQLGAAKSAKDWFSTFAKDPVGLSAELITESTAALFRHGINTIPARVSEGAFGGAIIGTVANPGAGTVAGFMLGANTGMIFGMGETSLNLEYSGKIIESIQNLGYDVTKAEELEKAFSDGASMAEIKKQALLKGVPIAAFDAFSAGIAGRIFTAPAKSLAGKATQWGTELITQGALGAGGEVAGQAAAGEELSFGAAANEFIGEVAFSPVEIASNKIIDGVRKGTATINDFVQANKVEKKLGKPGDLGQQAQLAEQLGHIDEDSKQFIDQQLSYVDIAEQQVPKDVPDRDNAVALIAERIGLEKQKERTDPAFHKPLNDRIKEINDELNPEEVDESEKSADEIIDAARSGDKKAQERLEKYGLDWTKNRVFRFVNKGEVDALLNNERIEGRFKDIGADVTISESPTTAASSEYRVTFKDTDKFDNKKSGSAVKMKNEEDGHLRGGYDINDVEKIERQTEDGGWEVVYKVKDAVQTIGEKTTASESAESGTVMPEGNVSPTSAEEEFPDARKNAQVGKFYTYPGQKEPHELIEIINDKSGKPMSYLIKGEDGKPFNVSDSVFMDFDEVAPKSEQEIEAEKKGKRHELISEYLAAREAGEFTPPKQQLIADRIHKIREEDFKDFGDKNLKTGGVARQWFSKDALPLDVIAQEMSTEGMEITPQDIIDFVMEYTSGLGGKNSVSEKTFYGKWNLKSKQRDIETDYEKLTGKKLDDNELQQYWNEIEAELGEVEIPEGESLVDQVPEEKRASIGEIIAKYTDENGITDWERMDNDINDFPPNENFTNLAQDAAKQLRQQIKERLSQPKPTTAEGKAGNLPAEKVATSDQRKQELEKELTEVDASLKKAEQDYKSDKAIRQAEADLQRAKDSIKKNIEGKQTDAFRPTQQMLIDDTDEKSAEVTRRQKIVDDLRKDKEREISKLKEKAANLQQQIDQITPGQIRMDVPEAQGQEVKQDKTARDAAKDFISPYVKKGWTIKQLQQGQGGVYGGGVRVQIGGYTDSGKRIGTDKIVVSQVNGKKIEPEIFSLKELYDEIAGQEQKVIDLTGGPINPKTPDERIVTEQDIKDAEKKTQRLIRDEKLKKDIDNLWDDFTSAGGKLTSGIDPERLAIGIKIIGKYTQAGIYKLSDILTDASAKLGEKFADYFDAIKAAYNAFYSEAPDDVADKMDDMKTVRGMKVEQFEQKAGKPDIKEIRKHWRTVEVDGVMYRPVQEGEEGIQLKGYNGDWIAISEKSWEMPAKQQSIRHSEYFEKDGKRYQALFSVRDGKEGIQVLESEKGKPIAREVDFLSPKEFEEKYGIEPIGFNREEYQNINIENKAANTRYNNGKTIKQTIDEHIAEGYTQLKGKRLIRDAESNDFIILREGTELDYAKIAVKKVKLADNVPSTTTNLESDSPRTDAPNAMGAENVQSGTQPSEEGTATAGTDASRAADTGQSDNGLPTDTPTSVRIKSHKEVSGKQQLFGFDADTPGVADSEASRQSDEQGYDAEAEREEVLDEFADDSFERKLELQKKANNTPWERSKDNIRKSLPLLLDHQVDNVDKAERRFEKHKGFGIFDGTGTGKTLSGLGIAKRFLQQGKGNIIIVVPSDAKVTDWITEAEFVGIKARGLVDTKDGASGGVVVCTYANFYQNRKLSRPWDLVIYDEAHNINANKTGKTTSREVQHKNITGIPEYVRSVYYSEVDYYDTLKKFTDNGDKQGAKNFEEKVKAEVQRRIDMNKDNKVVFLTATPFAYHKNLFYADGYLFDTKKEFPGTRGSKDSGDPQDQFMVSYLGYRWGNKWRNNVQRPESGVDVGLLERELHEKLKKDGAITATKLDIPQDYSRNFLLVGASEEAKIGREMDRGLEIIYDDRKPDGKRKYEYLPAILRKKWTYVYKNRILEAIKAREVVPIAEKLIAKGNKVVVFHRYNAGTPTHPFRFDPYTSNDAELSEAEDMTEIEELGTTQDRSSESYKEFFDSLPKEALAEIVQFEEENPDLVNLDLSGLLNPIETFVSHFKERAVLFNGQLPKQLKKDNIRKFNDPNSKADIIVVNLAAGEAGLNLHDKQGAAQRYTFQLGLPVRPVQATQSEGRTYREGTQTDVHLLYPVLHFNWEKMAFADINDRNVTVENLAMGEQSRNMETTFKEGYANPINDITESTGKGGKAADSRMEAASQYEKAKTYYWKRAKKTSATKSAEGTDYYATPEPLGYKMVEWMDVRPNDHDLEPSAGHGAIARFFKPFAVNKFIEPSLQLSSELSINGQGDVIKENFEDHHIINKYDGIAMNSPYGHAGSTAIAHLEKALNHLRVGGRIVGIFPTGAFNEKFDKLLQKTYPAGSKPLFAGKPMFNDIRVVARIKLPSVTFKRAGTGVNTQVIILDKIAMDATGKPMQEVSPTREIDLSHIEDMNQLFDELENLSIRPREQALPNNQEYQKNQNTKAEPQIIAKAGIASQHTFKHTKTGETLHVVKLEQRVSDSDYSTFKQKAKNLGGYYSSYNKQGAIPGFIFKDKESADKMYQSLTGVVNDVQEQQKAENVDLAVNEMEHIKGKQYLSIEHAFDDLYIKIDAQKKKAELAQQFVGVKRDYAEVAPDDVDTKGEYSRAPRPLLESLARIGVATSSEGTVNIYETIRGVRRKVSSYNIPTWKIPFDKIIGNAIDVLEKLKIDTQGKAFALPFPPQLWNGFVSAVQAGLKAGMMIGDAVKRGVDWLSTQGVTPEEAEKYAKQYYGRMDKRRFTKQLMKDDKLSPEIKQQISQDAREYAVKRNILTVTEANAIIDSLGIDSAIRFALDFKNDLPIRVRVAMGQSIIKNLNSQLATATGQNKADILDRAVHVAEELAKYGTELGQGVQAFSLWSKLSPDGILQFYQNTLNQANNARKKSKQPPKVADPNLMQELLELAAQRDEAPEGFLQDEITVKILNKISDAAGVRWDEVLWSLWYASILSGWQTQAVNAGGNIMNMGFETFVSGLEQAVVQRDLKAIPQLLTTLWDGLAEGSNQFRYVMEKGIQLGKKSDKVEAADALERVKFKGGKLNPYNYYKYVPRLMTAVDNAAYYGLYHMRFFEMARQIAREEGLSGTALEARTREIMIDDTADFARAKEQAEREIEALATVTGEDYKEYIIKKRAYEILDQRRRNKYPDAVTEADRFASFGTFNYPPRGFLGELAKLAATAGRKVPPFRAIVPFTRIVANVLNQQIDKTPYGFLRASGYNASSLWTRYKAKQGIDTDILSTSPHDEEQQHRALFTAAIGTTLMMGLMAATLMHGDDEDDGYFDITGRGPADANRRNQLYAQGWKPYSLRIGGKYISYQYTPLGMAFYLIGNWRDNEKYRELGEKDFFTRFAYSFYQTSSAIMEMSFLASLSQFMESLGRPSTVEGYVRESIGRTASTVKPLIPVVGTNLVKQASEVFDPTIYDAETISEGLMKGLPIVQQVGLEPQINILGQDVEKSGNRFWAIESSDKVWKMLAEKEVFIPAIGRATKLNGTPMSHEQYREFVNRSGEQLYNDLSANYDKYSKMDAAHLEEKIEEVATDIRKKVKADMELTDLINRVKGKGDYEAVKVMVDGKYSLREAAELLQNKTISPQVYQEFVKKYTEKENK